MADGIASISSHHAQPPKKKDLEGAEVGGAFLAQQPPKVFGGADVQLTEKQKNVSVFC